MTAPLPCPADNLVHQRCAHHAFREAVARCPECGGYFCRECITEHADRVLCAACLRQSSAPLAVGKGRFTALIKIAQCLSGLLVAWVFFFYFGQLLLSMPASFHEGTVWQTGWWEGP